MTSRRFLNLIRFVCLACAAAAIATAWSWDRIRVHIDPWDEARIAGLMGGPEAALAGAIDQLRAGQREDGIKELMDLGKGLSSVRLGSRLEHVKTTTLDLLCGELLAADRLDEALEWSDELLRFNPRDFPARVRRGEIHRRLGNEAEELMDLEAAYAVGAASGAGVAPYVEAMTRRGDREAVASALLGAGSVSALEVPLSGWEFRSATGPDFAFQAADPMTLAAAKPTAAETSSRLTWRLDAGAAPRTVRSVRVDLPSACLARIGAVAVRLRTTGGDERELDLDDLVVANHMTRSPEGALIAGGELDPYIILMAQTGPEESLLPVEEVASVEIFLDVAPSLSDSVRDLFQGGLDEAERTRWTQRFGASAVAALEAGLGR